MPTPLGCPWLLPPSPRVVIPRDMPCIKFSVFQSRNRAGRWKHFHGGFVKPVDGGISCVRVLCEGMKAAEETRADRSAEGCKWLCKILRCFAGKRDEAIVPSNLARV